MRKMWVDNVMMLMSLVCNITLPSAIFLVSLGYEFKMRLLFGIYFLTSLVFPMFFLILVFIRRRLIASLFFILWVPTIAVRYLAATFAMILLTDSMDSLMCKPSATIGMTILS